MSFTSLLIETFTPYTITETSDSQGGYTKAEVAGTAFSGRLSGLTTSEKMAQDKETAIATHKIFCAVTVDVDPDDRIKLGTRVFEVIGVKQPSNMITYAHKEILVREVDYDL